MQTHLLEISLSYLALLGLIYAALALVIVFLRARLNVPYGDGGNQQLLSAIRAHGNFQEWVPITCLLIVGIEIAGYQDIYIHSMMIVLVIARVMHPIGIYSKVGTPSYLFGRISGALSTWLVLLAACILIFTPVEWL